MRNGRTPCATSEAQWNGINRPRLYLRTLLIMHTTNIVLSYVLIFGPFGLPAFGATGAALGTMGATWFGTVTYVALGARFASVMGPGMLPTAESLRTLFALALPSSVQQLLFAGGFLALFTIIGDIGTTEVAAAGVLINVTLVAALGRGEPEDAARWGWDVVRVGIVGLGLLGLPMLLVPEWCLMPFLWGRPETIAVAAGPLRLVGGR